MLTRCQRHQCYSAANVTPLLSPTTLSPCQRRRYHPTKKTDAIPQPTTPRSTLSHRQRYPPKAANSSNANDVPAIPPSPTTLSHWCLQRYPATNDNEIPPPTPALSHWRHRRRYLTDAFNDIPPTPPTLSKRRHQWYPVDATNAIPPPLYHWRLQRYPATNDNKSPPPTPTLSRLRHQRHPPDAANAIPQMTPVLSHAGSLHERYLPCRSLPPRTGAIGRDDPTRLIPTPSLRSRETCSGGRSI